MSVMKNRINALLPMVIIPLLLAGLLLGAFVLRNYLVGALYAGFQDSLRNELITIEQALEYAFQANDFHAVQKVAANLSYQSPIRVIRIINLKGDILASSVPEEVGVHLDLNSPPCRSCHTAQNAVAASFQQIPLSDAGERVMASAKILDNQVACQSCHANAGESLGLILVDHEVAPLEAQTAGLSLRIYGGAGILFLLLAGAFGFGYSRLIARPLRSLVAGAANPATYARQDELGALARRLQGLEAEVQERGTLLDDQRRSFHALVALSESIDVTMTAEKVLQFAIGKVHEVTGFAAIAMRLFDANQKCFRLVAQSGMTPRMVDDLRCIPAEIGFTGDVYKTHRAAYTSNLSADQRLESPSPPAAGYQSLISVPFLSGDRLMGSMELAAKEVHVWSEDEVRWLELMGRSIGTVLHHIETSNQLQGMAVMHERSRIAQEIHDGLAQLIGTLRIWAEQAQVALQDNDLREVHNDLQKIEQSARDAYGGLREEILGLRDVLLPGRGVASVIREFLSRYQRQWGIETQLLVQQNGSSGEGRPSGAGQLAISPAAEIQLLRIIQEGLANVRRHANASRVVISLQAGANSLRVEIRDNGQGFDQSEVPEDKFGLRIMRERAASVGGRVSVNARRGEGTLLIVELPNQDHPSQVLPWTSESEEVE
jgi:nitrate/nitrite-specific signal transduction histidine kinase